MLDEIEELLPFEDRARERAVFASLKDVTLRSQLTSACKLAGIAHYHPHDLRHRRISLWFALGIDQITIKTWAGHAKASISSDVYGHVVNPGEDDWADFWRDAYVRERLPKGAKRPPREARVRPTDEGGD